MRFASFRSLGLCAAISATLLAGATPARSAASGTTLDPVAGYADWIGTRADAPALHGKVVIVDVFTFGCYNCKNITPNLRALHKSHPDGLEIVGIHTPETSYERDRKNVVANLATLGIVWPVAVDNDHKLWDAYNIEYWPTQLIFDKHGVLRKTVVGDSQDDVVDATVATLLAER